MTNFQIHLRVTGCFVAFGIGMLLMITVPLVFVSILAIGGTGVIYWMIYNVMRDVYYRPTDKETR